MRLWETGILAVGLGVDAMSVCAAIGVTWHSRRQKLRLAGHMGLFQFLMPILGWWAGQGLAGLIRGVGRYVAAALVFGIGFKMLLEALHSHPGAVAERTEQLLEGKHRRPASDPTRGWSLVALSLATSLDALAAGLSLGLRGEGSTIWQISIVIGVVAAGMALAGMIIGQQAGRALGRSRKGHLPVRAEIVGAAVLMALGISFLWL